MTSYLSQNNVQNLNQSQERQVKLKSKMNFSKELFPTAEGEESEQQGVKGVVKDKNDKQRKKEKSSGVLKFSQSDQQSTRQPQIHIQHIENGSQKTKTASDSWNLACEETDQPVPQRQNSSQKIRQKFTQTQSSQDQQHLQSSEQDALNLVASSACQAEKQSPVNQSTPRVLQSEVQLSADKKTGTPNCKRLQPKQNTPSMPPSSAVIREEHHTTKSPQTTTSCQDSDLGFALSERKKAHELKQRQLRQVNQELQQIFGQNIPYESSTEPDCAPEHFKKEKSGQEEATVDQTRENDYINSGKVQTRTITTACFGREDPLSQITNTHLNRTYKTNEENTGSSALDQGLFLNSPESFKQTQKIQLSSGKKSNKGNLQIQKQKPGSVKSKSKTKKFDKELLKYFRKIVKSKPGELTNESSRNNIKTAQLSPRQLSSSTLKVLGPKAKVLNVQADSQQKLSPFLEQKTPKQYLTIDRHFLSSDNSKQNSEARGKVSARVIDQPMVQEGPVINIVTHTLPQAELQALNSQPISPVNSNTVDLKKAKSSYKLKQGIPTIKKFQIKKFTSTGLTDDIPDFTSPYAPSSTVGSSMRPSLLQVKSSKQTLAFPKQQKLSKNEKKAAKVEKKRQAILSLDKLQENETKRQNFVLTQALPSMHSEPDTVNAKTANQKSEASHQVNLQDQFQLQQRFFCTFSKPSSQSTEKLIDLSPQKSVRENGQTGSSQGKMVVKLSKRQKKTMIYSNTIKQFPLFESSKRTGAPIIAASKLKKESMNMSKTNSVGFITARSVSGGKKDLKGDSQKEVKNRSNSYCDSADSKTVSNRHSFVGSSMRQSPLPLREYSFGSISGQGASKGITKNQCPETSVYQIKPAYSEQELIQSNANSQPRSTRKINIIKPTEPKKQILNKNFPQFGSLILNEMLYNPEPANEAQDLDPNIRNQLNRTTSEGILQHARTMERCVDHETSNASFCASQAKTPRVQNQEHSSQNPNVVKLYSQLSDLLLKKEANKQEPQQPTAKTIKKNNSFSVATHHDKNQILLSPARMFDLKTLGQNSSVVSHKGKAKRTRVKGIEKSFSSQHLAEPLLGNLSSRQRTKQQLMAQVNAALAGDTSSKLKQAILKSDQKASKTKNDTQKYPFQSLLAQTNTVSSLLVPSTAQPNQQWKSRNIQDSYKKVTKSGLVLLSPTDSKSISMLNQSKTLKGGIVTKTSKKVSHVPPFSSASMLNMKHSASAVKNNCDDGRPQVVEVSQNCLNTKLWEDYRSENIGAMSAVKSQTVLIKHSKEKRVSSFKANPDKKRPKATRIRN